VNPELSYFLGLTIGGGEIIPDSIIIRFPYKRWIRERFEISAQWFSDSVDRLVPLIRDLLNVQARPQIILNANSEPVEFVLEIPGVPQLIYELFQIGRIRPLGKLREQASIKGLIGLLDDEGKKQLVSGLADTIGSYVASQRRRHGGVLVSNVVSFEILQTNYWLAEVLRFS